MGAETTTFEFIMIKPSHYDDDGYPIVWWKTLLPSNSLAALNGLARDAAARQVLGPGVDIRLTPIDECNRHVVPSRIVRGIRRRGGRALIGLVGVQSNQFPHALDLAREFRAAGLPVVIGGFHVSGCLSMLKEIPPEIQDALDIGCSLFAGEAEEGRLDGLLRDAWNGELKPVYNHLNDLPSLAGVPYPWMPRESLARNLGVARFSEDMLTQPELNIHFGMAYLADQLRNYGDRLDAVLAAYNAGPTRVNRWRSFPEYQDRLLFAERIPYDETRDYVRIVQNNRRIYAALYGDEIAGAGVASPVER